MLKFDSYIAWNCLSSEQCGPCTSCQSIRNYFQFSLEYSWVFLFFSSARYKIQVILFKICLLIQKSNGEIHRFLTLYRFVLVISPDAARSPGISKSNNYIKLYIAFPFFLFSYFFFCFVLSFIFLCFEFQKRWLNYENTLILLWALFDWIGFQD